MKTLWISALSGLFAVVVVVGGAAAQTKPIGTSGVRPSGASPTGPINGRPVGTPGFVPSGQSPTGPNGFLPGGTRFQGNPNVTLGAGAIYGTSGWFPYYGYYPPNYPAYPYGSYGTYPYGNYSPLWNNSYYYPGYYYQPAPVFMPTDELFGPASIQRQMQFRSPPRNSSNRTRTSSRALNNVAAARNANVPPIAGKSRGDARQFVQYGDDYFRKGQYAEALQRYRRAAVIDPTLAEALFRQGHAFVALGTYDRAADLYQRGLELDPDWAQSAGELDELYGPSTARNEHREALESAAEDQPRDADLLFVLGVQLYFDHETQRGIDTLRRAAELGAANQVAIETFLHGIPSNVAADGVQVGNGRKDEPRRAVDDEAAPPKPAGEE